MGPLRWPKMHVYIVIYYIVEKGSWVSMFPRAQELITIGYLETLVSWSKRAESLYLHTGVSLFNSILLDNGPRSLSSDIRFLHLCLMITFTFMLT